MFKGAIVAIVTPFKNGEIDETALRDLIEFQIDQIREQMELYPAERLENLPHCLTRSMIGLLKLPSMPQRKGSP